MVLHLHREERRVQGGRAAAEVTTSTHQVVLARQDKAMRAVQVLGKLLAEAVAVRALLAQMRRQTMAVLAA